MDVRKYLARISCSGSCPPTLETLRYVHLNHLMAVPFENLTVHIGERVRLELPLLYEKIVFMRRGGFCFENNGLFSWLLSQMGFDVTILSAQVRNRFTGAYGPPFDHFIMMVKLDGHRWLCDVGFGSGFQLPLSLETDSPQAQSHGVYRIRSQGDFIFMEMKSETEVSGSAEECWLEQYKFTLESRERDDFRAMCDYHQSSVSSIFFCKSLCSLLLPTGRITIMGRKLIITSLTSEDGQQAMKTTTDLSNEEITELLREKFGIVLPSPLTPKDVEIVPPPVTY
ncbi:arylamine N-acetyltransferase, pineal gland isozyme NAT-3-like [Rhinichthys klamathensis goyatoka]|uniref:arylamine N-acetyltransferase, pineal gland isozyme NAT-3-like n=1 Tax=Rhinichthys klamathensis goyatoka TaxID=3034132 RepID=UPI0024B54019|nr:arylamine N-acetyltransferase, pineal gland isozyme NAT-3-like [Rhinichthys klamathensis goyatoka]